jgi:hypothetical protein
MAISRDEAAQTLKDVEHIETLSGELRSYRGASPYFFVWGLVWMLGYAGSDVAPGHQTLVWGACLGLGAVCSTFLGQRHSGFGKSSLWRSLAIAGGMAAFIGTIFLVMSPMRQNQADAIVPLIVAAIYTLAGLRFGLRFTICGVLLGALTVLGLFLAGDHFGIWMAAVGGGCLLLTGFWLRRV